MGRKKQRANKKKRHNFNKTKRNSNKLKSSPKKSVDSNAISPCPSDLQRFLIDGSDDSMSTTSSEDIDYSNAVYWNRNLFNESSTDTTSKFESLAQSIANFSFQNKATVSGLTASSTEEKKVTEHACFLTSGKTNSSKPVTTRTEDIEYVCGIPSTGAQVGYLDNVRIDSLSPDAIDFPKSAIVVEAENELESLNNIDSMCRDYIDPSTSMVVIDKGDPQSPICPPNNVAVSLTDDVTYPQNRPIFKGNRLNCSPVCINNEAMTIINTKYIENGIPSTNDDIGSLNNIRNDFLSQDDIDFVESTVVINAKNVLESLNNIDSQCRDSTDPSTSMVVIDKGNLQYPVCHSNNSSVSLTYNVIESQSRFIINGIDRLNCSSVDIDNGSKLSTKPADIKMLSSNNSSHKKITYFHSQSTKVESLEKSSFITTKCEDVLVLCISREVDLHERIIKEEHWILEMLSWLDNCKFYINTKFKSRYFRKIKRNACIKSMFTKKLKEFFECSQSYTHLVKQISKCCQENSKFQLRKMIEILKTYEECVSNSENCPFDEDSNIHKDGLAKLAIEYRNLKQLDNLEQSKPPNEKLSMLKKFIKHIESLIEKFFKYF